jgi:hypothetical protein
VRQLGQELLAHRRVRLEHVVVGLRQPVVLHRPVVSC